MPWGSKGTVETAYIRVTLLHKYAGTKDLKLAVVDCTEEESAYDTTFPPLANFPLTSLRPDSSFELVVVVVVVAGVKVRSALSSDEPAQPPISSTSFSWWCFSSARQFGYPILPFSSRNPC